MPVVSKRHSDQVGLQVDQGLQTNGFASSSAAIAEGVSQVANTVRTNIQTNQQRADTAQAREASVAFEREYNDLFFNTESGYFNTTGRNAFDGADGVKTSLQNLKQKYVQGLPPSVAEEFGRVADNRITGGLTDIDRHSSKNLKAYEVSSIKAGVENTLENASFFWSDPERVGVQRELGRQAIHDAAALSGDSPEAVAESLQNFESQFAVNVVSSAINKSADIGKQYLDKWVKTLEPQDKRKLEGLLDQQVKGEDVSNTASFAVSFARSTLDKYEQEPNARALILEELKSIDDPKLFKAARTEALKQLGDLQQARDENAAALYESASEFATQGKLVEWQIANSKGWAGLTPKHRQALEKVAQGGKVETSIEDWQAFSLLSDSEKVKFKPGENAHKYSQKDLRKIIDIQASIRKGDTASARRAEQPVTSLNDFTKQFYPTTAGLRGDKLKEFHTNRNTFREYVSSQIEFAESEKGSPLTGAETTEVYKGISNDAIVQSPAWYNTANTKDVPFDSFEIDEVTDVSTLLNQLGLPANTQTIADYNEALPIIEQKLRSRGDEVSPENIAKMFQDAKNRAQQKQQEQ